jgi:hypothetical protein
VLGEAGDGVDARPRMLEGTAAQDALNKVEIFTHGNEMESVEA